MFLLLSQSLSTRAKHTPLVTMTTTVTMIMESCLLFSTCCSMLGAKCLQDLARLILTTGGRNSYLHFTHKGHEEKSHQSPILPPGLPDAEGDGAAGGAGCALETAAGGESGLLCPSWALGQLPSVPLFSQL